MGRPSKASERTEQILEAAIRTIAKYGYAQTTLDRIAEESGLARGHIRHYLGNRQDILRKAARAYYSSNGDRESFLPPSATTVKKAIDFLFSAEFIGTTEEHALVFGFIEAARSDSVISDMLIEVYLGAEREFVELLRAEHPKVPAARLKSMAFAVVSMAIHNIFLHDISVTVNSTRLAKSSAKLVVAELSSP
jgi:AcrR family transcriptional regulator